MYHAREIQVSLPQKNMILFIIPAAFGVSVVKMMMVMTSSDLAIAKKWTNTKYWNTVVIVLKSNCYEKWIYADINIYIYYMIKYGTHKGNEHM